MDILATLDAMRADAIPEGDAGLWSVRRVKVATDQYEPKTHRWIKKGQYTQLSCLTTATLHQPPGECVMIDNHDELLMHMNFLCQARGRVLVSGLGLGCVVRGLLAKSDVEQIDVVEKEEAVLRLVAPSMPQDPRLQIHETDAFKYPRKQRYDYAWHDLWVDENGSGPSLQLLHGKLMVRYAHHADWQGAWQFPREMMRLFQRRCGSTQRRRGKA